MSEKIKNNENLQKNNEVLEKLNEADHILAIEKLFNPENNPEKNGYLNEQTKNCCANLNDIFYAEIAKKWFDFSEALKAKVPNPVWFDA